MVGYDIVWLAIGGYCVESFMVIATRNYFEVGWDMRSGNRIVKE